MRCEHVNRAHLLAFSLRSSLRCLKPPTYFLHSKELKQVCSGAVMQT